MARDPIELSAYLDGALDGPERRRVEARLASDADYAEELARLERVRTMLGLCIDEPSLAGGIVDRIRAEEQRIRSRRRRVRLAAGFLVAAAVVVVAVSIVQVAGIGPRSVPPHPEQPPLLAVNPADVTPGAAETSLLAAADSLEPEQAARENAESPILPIELLGTITGPKPSAVIAVESGGMREVRTFGLGDTVLGDAQLLEVQQGAVVLSVQGSRVTVAKTQNRGENRLAILAGIWDLFEISEAGALRQIDQFGVDVNGDQLQAVSKKQGTKASVRAYASGAQMRLMTEAGSGLPQEILGEFSQDGKAFDMCIVRDEDGLAPADEEADKRYRLVRVTPEDVGRELEIQQRFAECMEEVTQMQKLLKRYADEHGGDYPSALDALVPAYANDLALFTDNDNRTVAYIPGQSAKAPTFSPPHPKEPAVEPIDSYPQRLMAYETDLRARGLDSCLSPGILLKVLYKSPPLEFVACAQGQVSSHLLADKMLYVSGEEGKFLLAQARAFCQNHLKQLGLVVKMYANEHQDYTPPGWACVVPEYLTDPTILTSPKDAPGTDSYEYLLPATNIEGLLMEMGKDLENPAGRAKAESEMPLVMNRSDWPGTRPGRNMLFADGHVQFIDSASLNEYLKRIP